MKKNKWLIILIMLLGGLVLILAGCSKKIGIIRLASQGKVDNKKNIESLEEKEESNKVEIEQETEIEKVSTYEEGNIENISISESKEVFNQLEIRQEVSGQRKIGQDLSIQWETSLDTINMLLPDINSEPRIETTTHVVIHFISNASNNPNNPYEINDTYSILEQYGVSSNYVIDREGKIYLFVPENRVAYHAGPGKLIDYPEYENRLNHYSIGIELLAIGTREEMIPVITAEKFDLINHSLLGYTDAQYESLNVLLEDIIKRNPSIIKDRRHIIGHDEYNPGVKTDPGSLFDWTRIGF
ncbi:hypothetical protein UT300007_29690 [Clostridium sp. CTA-7]